MMKEVHMLLNINKCIKNIVQEWDRHRLSLKLDELWNYNFKKVKMVMFAEFGCAYFVPYKHNEVTYLRPIC